MTTSFCLHDVKKITLKRNSASRTGSGEIHNWTTLVIEHRASGDDAEGEYAHLTVETEIVLHHFGSEKIPFRIKRAGS